MSECLQSQQRSQVPLTVSYALYVAAVDGREGDQHEMSTTRTNDGEDAGQE
jgi:hypothetical protein